MNTRGKELGVSARAPVRALPASGLGALTPKRTVL
eukprot:CAMPEP_0175462858 /NCGR_PEP_ID=MMETSP0095-20121207/68896_1 /TAXON_ID=311494 /ORGANISM="Alexandrium monilatum, Strain CCMP3105" /LENGTH=34 /DNA_ID= /DNA_START= /DNA_END= /DNA_ORIENTATION=